MEGLQQKFDQWCVVELFGHQKIAGRCTEQNIAGTNMLRVDVPETEKQPAFTRFFGSAAIYAINPVDEATAKLYADRLNVSPIDTYSTTTMLEKHVDLLVQQGRLVKALPQGASDHDDDNDDDDDDLFDDDRLGF